MRKIKPHTPATRKPSYLDGLDYIARNDDPECMNRDEVSGLISVNLLATLFGMPPTAVAFDVIRIRAFITKE